MKGTTVQRIGYGIGLFGLAIAIFFTIPIFSEWKVIDNATAISWGMSLIAIAFALIAIGIASNSDKRMAAMANLEFYEKIAVIQAYLENTIRTTSPSDSEADRAYADRIYYDIKGAKQLKEWVKDPEIEETLNKEIQRLLDKLLQGQTYKHVIKRLQQIQKEDC